MSELAYEDLYIVGIGASAGGFEALQNFVRQIEEANNVAYIIVQHLDPKQPTMLADLLSKASNIPIQLINDNDQIEAGKIYVCPQNANIKVQGAHFHLSVPEAKEFPKPSIDSFLNTLAKEKNEKAIAVILSGSGSDGKIGIKDIKNAGGVTVVQDLSEAKYSSMPQASLNTGMVDFVATAEQIARRIPSIISGDTNIQLSGLLENPAKGIARIFELLYQRFALDFSNYKTGTLHRRIERRMLVQNLTDLNDYVVMLESSVEELELLKKDLLVIVTSFFRDDDAFKALYNEILKLLRAEPARVNLRGWVAGCATGEEAYTMVLLFMKAHKELGRQHQLKLQIFATDAAEEAVETARKGVYSIKELDDIPEEFHEWLVVKDNYFEFRKEIRDCIIFSKHDIVRDPPFLKLDIVSCRNLMIYFNTDLQERVFNTFYAALNEHALLFLGKSESTSSLNRKLFNPLSANYRVYTKNYLANPPVEAGYIAKYPVSSKVTSGNGSEANGETVRPVRSQRHDMFIDWMQESLLASVADNAIIVSDDDEMIFLHGDVEEYLQIPKGVMDRNIFSYIRPEIRLDLRALVSKVRRSQRPATYNVAWDAEERGKVIKALTVMPIPSHQNFVIIVINQFSDDITRVSMIDMPGDDSRSAELEIELKTVRERLQTTIEELETSNEELQSTNEELQSSNEELQSTNEELQTSNEELQSTNEELNTVNDELGFKAQELNVAISDIENLFRVIDMGVIFLDSNMRIHRYTDSAKALFRLDPKDVGQMLTSVESELDLFSVKTKLQQVIDTNKRFSEVVRVASHQYHIAIEPYLSPESDKSGVVLSFKDITTLHDVQSELTETKEIASAWERRLVENSRHAIMGEMVAMIAHQWKQPLTALLLNQDVLMAALEGKDADKAFLSERLENNKKLVGELNQTIEDFGNFFSPDRERQEFSVLDAVDGTTALFASMLLGVNLDVSGEHVKVIAYKREFQQVLSNLLKNAIEQHKVKRTVDPFIKVIVTTRDNVVMLTVEDNAGGIDESVMQSLFEAYTSTKSMNGTGLGLYISKIIIEDHLSGTIEAKNTKLGAKFTITFPVKP